MPLPVLAGSVSSGLAQSLQVKPVSVSALTSAVDKGRGMLPVNLRVESQETMVLDSELLDGESSLADLGASEFLSSEDNADLLASVDVGEIVNYGDRPMINPILFLILGEHNA